ncbi:MAG TPA: type II toxin-antitoxin system VapC family toxin [Candidatus Aphodovivens avistercoris]|nr:type II toxin-antitoxin system VapC family toxin [Candidatus Aphodovivens avistercoris]
MRYVVDTNVVSELTKAQPNASAVAWISRHAADALLTAITIEEMRFGCLMLPEGKRRAKLSETIDRIVDVYASRILSFDAHAAEECARLHCLAIGKGRTPAIEDLMIAALCVCHDATLVTRNVRDFDCLGIEVLNPFEVA